MNNLWIVNKKRRRNFFSHLRCVNKTENKRKKFYCIRSGRKEQKRNQIKQKKKVFLLNKTLMIARKLSRNGRTMKYLIVIMMVFSINYGKLY